MLASRIVAPLKNLVTFSLCIDCSNIYDGHRARSVKVAPLEPTEEVLVGWDIDGFAHLMQQELSVAAKLQSITVSIQGHRTRRPETTTIGATFFLDDDPSGDEDGSGHASET